MRYVRSTEDDNGDLVELIYYCSWLCYAAEADPSIRALPGGAWPCLDTSLHGTECCFMCGKTLVLSLPPALLAETRALPESCKSAESARCHDNLVGLVTMKEARKPLSHHLGTVTDRTDRGV
jgi:hypothetical protein